MSNFEQQGTVMGSCAVRMPMDGGTMYECDAEWCEDKIKFMAKALAAKSLHSAGVVICNVYEGDRWDRMECYHPDCYVGVGEPYGDVLSEAPTEPIVATAIAG